MERVLVLDQSYMPISIISWKKAIRLVMLEKAEIVRESDRVIRSAKAVWKMPAVIRFLNKFFRPKKMVKFSRQNLFARDKWRCAYCGEKFDNKDLTYDHVVPKSKGGKTEWENIVTSCISCNAKKGNRTPQEAGMNLRKVPTKPDWVPIFVIKITHDYVPEYWKDFCYDKE